MKICLYTFFPRFQLSIDVPAFSFYFFLFFRFLVVVVSQTNQGHPKKNSFLTASSHIFCFKTVRNILQRPWHLFNNTITHFLRLKIITNILQLPWPFFNNIITHFLHLKVIRNGFQHPWLFSTILIQIP